MSQVQCEDIEFYSEGVRVRGVLKRPEGDGAPWPILVHGPGWLEVVGHPLTNRFHEGFVQGGYCVLQFDYRGWGKSEGERGWLRPSDQQLDIRNAIVYASTRPELDIDRLGLFGYSTTGGGNALCVAAKDDRVKAICTQTVIADGKQFMREQRREHEWVAFKRRLEADRIARVLTNESELVDPTEDIAVATPERGRTAIPLSGDAVSEEFYLGSADYLADFRPIDVVGRLGSCALLIACIEDDVVTPEHHARALFAAARSPKRLVVQREVGHYDGYTVNFDVLMQEFLSWYDRYLKPRGGEVPHDDVSEIVEVIPAHASSAGRSP